jgi:hypothetical protein
MPKKTEPTFVPSLLDDREIIIRVKRRVGPMNWHVVPYVLASLKDVLERCVPPVPDPFAPKPESTKKVALTSSGVPKRRARKPV